MCGILAIFGLTGHPKVLRQMAVDLQSKLRHRGPDTSGTNVYIHKGKYNILCHERLIVSKEISSDLGKMPLTSKADSDVVYIENGEIFNFPEIKKEFEGKYKFDENSDTQALEVLWDVYGTDICQHLNGMYAFVIYNKKTGEFYSAVDHVGIVPLFLGKDKNGAMYIASEMKALAQDCVEISMMKPGHYITNTWEQKPWYQPKWHDTKCLPTKDVNFEELREKLTEAVKSHLAVDVPFGLLITGGVDSAILAAITMKLVKEKVVDLESNGLKEVHSFTIGLAGSANLALARKIAERFGLTHHELVYTVEEGIDTMNEAVYHLETFNPANIRAGVPMYLMARKVKAYGVKVVLTGEGADEIFGGSKDFLEIDSDEELYGKLVEKVQGLYKYDLLGANKAMLAFGVETRTPYLHKPFLEYAMSIAPQYKNPQKNEDHVRKFILRKAFDNFEGMEIPKEVLWDHKKERAESLGKEWIKAIKDHVEEMVDEKEYGEREKSFGVNVPKTKEMFWLRKAFEGHYSGEQYVKVVPDVNQEEDEEEEDKEKEKEKEKRERSSNNWGKADELNGGGFRSVSKGEDGIAGSA